MVDALRIAVTAEDIAWSRTKNHRWPCPVARAIMRTLGGLAVVVRDSSYVGDINPTRWLHDPTTQRWIDRYDNHFAVEPFVATLTREL